MFSDSSANVCALREPHQAKSWRQVPPGGQVHHITSRSRSLTAVHRNVCASLPSFSALEDPRWTKLRIAFSTVPMIPAKG
jgi:hypothetical protein